MDFLKKIFSFSGRSGRLEYIGVHFLILLLVILPYFILLGGSASSSSFTGLMNSIGSSIMMYLILILPIIWIEFAVMFRRLHDINQPGWLFFIIFFISFIPIIGLVVYFLFFLVLLIWPGNKTKNRFDLIDCPNPECGLTNSVLSEKCFSCNTSLKENNDVITNVPLESSSQKFKSDNKQEIIQTNIDQIILDFDKLIIKDNQSERITEGLGLITTLAGQEFNSNEVKEITTKISKIFENIDTNIFEKKEIIENLFKNSTELLSQISNDKIKVLEESSLSFDSLNNELNKLLEIFTIDNRIQQLENYQISQHIVNLKNHKKNLNNFKDKISLELKKFEDFSNKNDFKTILDNIEDFKKDIESVDFYNTFKIVKLTNKIINNEELHISIRVHLKELLSNNNILFNSDLDNVLEIENKINESLEKIENIKSNFSKISNLNSDYLDSLTNALELELKTRDAKKRKYYIALIMIVILGFTLKFGIDYYENYKKEKAALEYEKKQLAQQKREEEKRKIAREKKRVKNNIKRVENTIFINNYITTIKNNILKDLQTKVIDMNKENEYQMSFVNKIDTLNTSTKKELSKICKNEAGKETSAIKKCIENNTSKLDLFTNSLKNQVKEKISNKIQDLKIENRDNLINKEINKLILTLKNNENKYSKLQANVDEYYLNNKKVPEEVKSDISKTKYEIDNLKSKIDYYQKIKNTNNFDFDKPSDLKKEVTTKPIYKQLDTTKVEKKIIQKVEIKGKKPNIQDEIKKIQEQIDDAFINGEKPNPELIKKLEKLKGNKR